MYYDISSWIVTISIFADQESKMSKRKILSADKVSESLYAKLMEIQKPENHALIVGLFKNLETRRKCYKLGQFGFEDHATEYFMPNFFSSITFAGRTRLIPIEEERQIKLVKSLSALMNLIGYESTYDSMLDRLEEVSDANLSQNKLIEIIPEMIYGYAGPKRDILYLKLEYYFGAEVIDILDVHNVEINTGKPRVNKQRARNIAKLNLAGKASTKPRTKAKSNQDLKEEENI